jgi:hypothetical protein
MFNAASSLFHYSSYRVLVQFHRMGPSEPLVSGEQREQSTPANSHAHSTYSTMHESSTMHNAHSDPLLKDRKKLPNSDLTTAIPSFLFFLLVVTPFWACVLLPFTLCVQGFLYAGNLCTGTGKPKRADSGTGTQSEDTTPVSTSDQKEERIYDIIVFGATGFTGKMAVMYLASRYGTTVRWAIAGR